MRFPPIITPPRRVIGSLKESLQGYYFLLYDLHIYTWRFENRCFHYKITLHTLSSAYYSERQNTCKRVVNLL